METGIWRTPKSWPDVEEKESQSATIYMKRHSATPLILTSFTYFDIRKDAVRNQIRAWCYADDVSPSHFRIHADTWADNLLYTAKVGWIAIPGGHTGILGGTCLVAPHEPDQDKKWNGIRIPFQEVFSRTPKIFICLNYIDIGRSWSIETFTENVTTSSFDAVFTSRNPNVDVWSAGATWIAYEDDLDSVEGGSIYSGYWTGSKAQSWEGTVRNIAQ
ncbi:hypothetical protein SISSUDRAFT_1066953 [Sistotremastrum suecicum HHB10207 ss-3]|uniref:H-type lectin domain-containing protein n=1 Tax=Sistotremastrum suecicum HHB10207 ss-3 TaxID=1314776 RepID=A0A165XPD9_9AGAM|nr:hypothetical protein SISSUDRAFT_1066953 [Sistotremastrum suecicum HHB10207 ss-3]